MGNGKHVNGVDVEELAGKIELLRQDPELARCVFRIVNGWETGGQGETAVRGFFGAGGEQRTEKEPFRIRVDEPELLCGTDTAPNPVEYLLHALTTCLTNSMVFHAAARGIVIEELASSMEGDIDIQGFLGLKEDVRKGYQNIRITFKVKSDGTEEQLRECALFSPVFDVVTNGTKVDVRIEKK
jgi:uncharacterized OsmC-like protein